MNYSNDEKRALSRREALKTLAAATGAIALANLPDQWDTPIIETGIVPAHAQTSPTTPISPTVPFTVLCDPPPDIQAGIPAIAKTNFTGDAPQDGTVMTLSLSPAIISPVSVALSSGQATFLFTPPASSSGQTVALSVGFATNSITTISGDTVDVSGFNSSCGSITIP